MIHLLVAYVAFASVLIDAAYAWDGYHGRSRLHLTTSSGDTL